MKRQVPEGATVRFAHGRVVDGQVGTFYRGKGKDGKLQSWREEGLAPSPRGGVTSCKITLPDGRETIGVAECSEKDNYSKKIGRDIALGRALAQLDKPKAL